MDVRKIAAVDLLRLATLAVGSSGENGVEVFEILDRSQDVAEVGPDAGSLAIDGAADKLAKPEA